MLLIGASSNCHYALSSAYYLLITLLHPLRMEGRALNYRPLRQVSFSVILRALQSGPTPIYPSTLFRKLKTPTKYVLFLGIIYKRKMECENQLDLFDLNYFFSKGFVDPICPYSKKDRLAPSLSRRAWIGRSFACQTSVE